MVTYRLLKFEAPWCAPCVALSKVLEEVLVEYPNINLEPINADKNKDVCLEYGVRSIPLLILLDPEGNRQRHLSGLPGRPLNAAQVKEIDEYKQAQAAVKTLTSLGYTYHGGVLWKPPLGQPPKEFQ